MTISLIYARSQNGVIGKDNALPWNLPEDLKHFKEMTMGGFVVMGRKTWESLPEKHRPLSGRVNIVLTRDLDYKAPGAIVFNSAYQVLAFHDTQGKHSKFWVIGGEQIFNRFISQADQVIQTVILEDIEGDSVFKADEHLKLSEYTRSRGPELTSSTSLRFYIEELHRRSDVVLPR